MSLLIAATKKKKKKTPNLNSVRIQVCYLTFEFNALCQKPDCSMLCRFNVYPGRKKKLLHKYFEDIAKLLQLLLRNTNFPLFFFKVYITTLP